ncbi:MULTISPECIES: anaerobic glycerol-3-phosphate dehydrogenase subunit C [unclassified Actinobaculum]|uniref:anaerobic glycerol-3-phosphate dehydrogenase subunit C n=1 Tax=unclassified Actinobaculum TaxID=2609299 RepID=UPI000D528D71|nr:MULTISPECIES: anaerobic glycerol-3-phosphate dehydrogenase subunit C [unclassified Actinobaculum]AWE42956.1 anaerobic glycerol-3-phosphate dehydrogenase subunit C [Actinobaculum sp. 313]RTE48957.1 anaerobic glycerol-3-phosphate dehydrogenase subunit C [Actinobaculum sp. 352]
MTALDNARASLARASLDQCVKCTICETQCPVAEATPLFPGPKYVGPQAERLRHGESVDYSLDYCSGCSICSTVCPQGVKIAEINAQARAVMKANHMPLRDRLITQTELEGKLLTPFAPIANAALKNRPIRKVVSAVVGVHEDAPMPKAQRHSFQHWFKRHTPVAAPTRGPLVFFHGCAGGYFEVETSKATVEVLEYLGYEVIVPPQGCCGLAFQSNGLFDSAAKKVRKLANQLRAAGEDLTIISSSGSCAGMMRHEAHEIMGLEDSELLDVGSRMVETSEFLVELLHKGEFPVGDLRRINAVIPYHQPCQVKSQGIGKPAIELMEAIPGVTVIESGRGCCGIAGTYGLKKEKYEVAQRVGRPLFDMVRSTNPNLAACETETCRWQIRKGSGAEVIHPVQLIHAALGLGGAELVEQAERAGTAVR